MAPSGALGAQTSTQRLFPKARRLQPHDRCAAAANQALSSTASTRARMASATTSALTVLQPRAAQCRASLRLSPPFSCPPVLRSPGGRGSRAPVQCYAEDPEKDGRSSRGSGGAAPEQNQELPRGPQGAAPQVLEEPRPNADERRDGERPGAGGAAAPSAEGEGPGAVSEAHSSSTDTEASGKEQKEYEERRRKALERALRRQTGFGRGFAGDAFVKAKAVIEEALSITRDENVVEHPKLDIKKLRECFSYTDFWAVEEKRYGSGAMFTGNLRAPVAEVRAKLLPRLTEAAGCPLVLFFLVDDAADRQVVVVQPQAEVEERLEIFRMKGLGRWPLATLGLAACAVTVTHIYGVAFDPFGLGTGREHVVQFAAGLAAVIGVGEIFERIMASRYGVALSLPYLIPGPLGCLGCATRTESLVPSRAAMLDIAAARPVGSFMTAMVLAAYALISDGGVSGGPDPLYVQPEFFDPNWLVSFVQFVIGPYADDLGNVMPNALEGVGVPVNPLAFAGLLGMVSTALNLLPAGRLEGGRIAQAVLGRRLARQASWFTTLALGLGGISGSVLCLTWTFVVLFFRAGPDLPCEEEVTPIGKWRVFLAWVLLGASLLLLLPNSAGTFPTFFNPSGL